MKTSRRDFLWTSAAAAASVAYGGSLFGSDEISPAVAAEMRRRLNFLTSPDGSLPLTATPSPLVEPFTTALFIPPTAVPLIDLSGAENKALSNDEFWAKFCEQFTALAKRLRARGWDIGAPPIPDSHQRFWEFRPVKFYILWEKEMPWTFHKDYGRQSWMWGFESLSRLRHRKAEHQKDFNFAPAEDQELAEAMAPADAALKMFGSCPGPTFRARYGEPILVRRINALPEIVEDDALWRRRDEAWAGAGLKGKDVNRRHLKFALPSTTSHLHNGHTASESDGNPNDWINPGEYWDHHYGNFASGHDEREKLSTLWYHDHRMDFTASNVYAGLDGFYLLFDEKEKEAEQPSLGDFDDETKGWQLPAGQEYDVPLILHDLLFAHEDEGAKQSPQLVFDGFNTDGILGDRYTVNRIIQPKMPVERRMYRFRLLNGGPSRFYELYLHQAKVEEFDQSSADEAASAHPEGASGASALSLQNTLKGGNPMTEGAGKPGQKSGPDLNDFIVITGDGNFQPNPVFARSIYIGVAQRVDVIIDFSQFAPGAQLYLVNKLEQVSGKGPTERRLAPGRSAPGQQVTQASVDSFLKEYALMRFDVAKEAPEPAPVCRVPLAFRELPPVDLTEAKRERVWNFDYDGGLWTINGKTFDPNRIDAGIEQDTAEIWTFRNEGTGWHHPIHSHFTEFLILEQNGVPFYHGEIQQGAVPREEGHRSSLRNYLPGAFRARLWELQASAVKADQELFARARNHLGESLLGEIMGKSKGGLVPPLSITSAEALRTCATVLDEIGVGLITLRRFMGGPRRDVALLLPGWEVKVFMRWKDFVGKHIMHCHNVVHEDHAMMIRWDIMPPGKGFDTPKRADEVYGKPEGIPHVQPEPAGARKHENDSDAQLRR